MNTLDDNDAQQLHLLKRDLCLANESFRKYNVSHPPGLKKYRAMIIRAIRELEPGFDHKAFKKGQLELMFDIEAIPREKLQKLVGYIEEYGIPKKSRRDWFYGPKICYGFTLDFVSEGKKYDYSIEYKADDEMNVILDKNGKPEISWLIAIVQDLESQEDKIYSDGLNGPSDELGIFDGYVDGADRIHLQEEMPRWVETRPKEIIEDFIMRINGYEVEFGESEHFPESYFENMRKDFTQIYLDVTVSSARKEQEEFKQMVDVTLKAFEEENYTLLKRTILGYKEQDKKREAA